MQQRARDGSLEIRKARWEVSPADLFIKLLSSEEHVFEVLRLFVCSLDGGRAAHAPQLRKDVGVSYSGILAVDVSDGQTNPI